MPIWFTKHATKRRIEHNIEEDELYRIINKGIRVQDLQAFGNSNRFLIIGKIDRKYWTLPCVQRKKNTTIITVKKANRDEIFIYKKRHKYMEKKKKHT